MFVCWLPVWVPVTALLPTPPPSFSAIAVAAPITSNASFFNRSSWVTIEERHAISARLRTSGTTHTARSARPIATPMEHSFSWAVDDRGGGEPASYFAWLLTGMSPQAPTPKCPLSFGLLGSSHFFLSSVIA
jgi:hypothetical protein